MVNGLSSYLTLLPSAPASWSPPPPPPLTAECWFSSELDASLSVNMDIESRVVGPAGTVVIVAVAAPPEAPGALVTWFKIVFLSVTSCRRTSCRTKQYTIEEQAALLFLRV